jgi:hypothetical protein
MIAAAVILAVIVLVCILRVGITVVYNEDGFALDAYFGPVRFQLFPSDKEKTKSGKKQKEKTQDTAVKAGVKAGKLESLKNQLPSIKKALSRLKRKLRIRELTIYYMAAGTDAAAAAMSFGAASVGYGIILPLLENNFKIKKRDLRASVSFEVTEPYIYVKAILSLALWEVFYVGFGLVLNIIKSERMKAKIRKAV